MPGLKTAIESMNQMSEQIQSEYDRRVLLAIKSCVGGVTENALAFKLGVPAFRAERKSFQNALNRLVEQRKVFRVGEQFLSATND